MGKIVSTGHFTGKIVWGELELTIIIIIAHHNLLELSVLAHLTPEILIESVKVILKLARIHLVLRIVCWVVVQVWKEDGLRVGGLDMLARTAVTMAAGANFVVERAVNLL